MQKDNFYERFQAFKIPPDELDRMYVRELAFKEQLLMLAENSGLANQGESSASGPGGLFEETSSPVAPFINPELTIGSAVTVESVSPFVGGGNSYLFSSSVNSYISTPGSDDWAVGEEDFTVEWFSNQTTLDQFQRIFTVGDFPTIKLGVSIESGVFYYWANDAFRFSSGGVSSNTWYHWALVRYTDPFTLIRRTSIYRNGVLQGVRITDNNNITDNTTPLIVGNTNTFATNAALVGYLTSFRFVKGLAVYTGEAFTVPTSPLTAEAPENPYGGINTAELGPGFTKLLLNP
jgi:hypothetical protein